MRKIYRKKRWLAAALSLCLGISLLPASAAAETVSISSLPVAGAEPGGQWEGWTELNANLLKDLGASDETKKEYKSLEAGRYYLAGDLKLEYALVIQDVNVTLDLNGHVLEGAGDKRVIALAVTNKAGKETKFTLQDSEPNAINNLDASQSVWKIADDNTKKADQRIVTGGVITGGYDGNCAGGLKMFANDGMITCSMEGGSIVGCQAGSDGGGGVCVWGKNAKFTMSGGAIFGNTTNGENKTPPGDALAGKDGANIEMSGGRIESENGRPDGANTILIQKSAMTQSGGEIKGKIRVNGDDPSRKASFHASGGTIEGDFDLDGDNVTCEIGPQVQHSGTCWYTVSFQVMRPDGLDKLGNFEPPRAQTVKKGECATVPKEPTSNEPNSSLTFSHWYLDDPKMPYDFATPVTKSIVLKAHMHEDESWNPSPPAPALVKAGTCTSAAIYSASACWHCGKGDPTATTSPGAIDPSNHEGPIGDWQSNETEHWRICSACQVEVDRGKHNYVNGTCSVCQAVQPTAPAPAPDPAPAPTPGSSGGSSSGSYTPAPTPQPTRPTPTVTVDQMGDVPQNVYFYEAVKWAAEMGITQGAADGSFKPYQSCSKNQLVTFLWRAAGCPKPSGTDADTDGAYYSEAVKWAAEAGIFDAKGNAAGGSAKFSRQQVASIVYRFAKALGYDLTQGDEKLMLSYNADEMTTEDLTAFRWACSNGILQPADGYLMPDGTVNRSQLIAMLYRLMAEKTDQ